MPSVRIVWAGGSEWGLRRPASRREHHVPSPRVVVARGLITSTLTFLLGGAPSHRRVTLCTRAYDCAIVCAKSLSSISGLSRSRRRVARATPAGQPLSRSERRRRAAEGAIRSRDASRVWLGMGTRRRFSGNLASLTDTSPQEDQGPSMTRPARRQAWASDRGQGLQHLQRRPATTQDRSELGVELGVRRVGQMSLERFL